MEKLTQIKNIEKIFLLSNDKKCVYFSGRGITNLCRIPAAFVINYQARLLIMQIKSGYWFYKK